MVYKIFNGPAPNDEPQGFEMVGTATTTTMQVCPLSEMKVIEWGISIVPSSVRESIPLGIVELCVTDTPAVVVNHLTEGIHPVDRDALRLQGVVRIPFDLGDNNSTGYRASREGNPYSVRLGDVQLVPHTEKGIYQYTKQFTESTPFFVRGWEYLRIRARFSSLAYVMCYVIVSQDKWELEIGGTGVHPLS